MFIIISGPSGAGKTPILYRIVDTYPNIKKIQSYTTRRIRNQEVNGTYIYMTRSQFEERIKSGFFLEYNKVHKDQEYYGTGLDSYKSVMSKGYVAIKDIDVDSYKNIRATSGIDIVGIYVTVKDRKILFDRLRERGETEKTINIRLFDRVDYENAQSSFYDYVVYTDNINNAFAEVEKIIDKEFEKRNIVVSKNKIDKSKKYIF